MWNVFNPPLGSEGCTAGFRDSARKVFQKVSMTQIESLLERSVHLCSPYRFYKESIDFGWCWRIYHLSALWRERCKTIHVVVKDHERPLPPSKWKQNTGIRLLGCVCFGYEPASHNWSLLFKLHGPKSCFSKENQLWRANRIAHEGQRVRWCTPLGLLSKTRQMDEFWPRAFSLMERASSRSKRCSKQCLFFYVQMLFCLEILHLKSWKSSSNVYFWKIL